MKIILPSNLLLKVNQKNFKSLINVINTKNKSTVISIKGKILEIPFLLDPKLKYTAEIRNNALYIYEKKIKKIFIEKNKDVKKNFQNIKKTLEKLFFFENKKKFAENEINYLLFDKLYSKINDRKQKEKKYKNFFLKNKNDEDYYFIFNLPYFNKLAKVFLKIDKNRNIYINLYSANLNRSENAEFIKKLNEIRLNVSKIQKVNFFENIEDFYKNIFLLFDVKKIDIKV